MEKIKHRLEEFSEVYNQGRYLDYDGEKLVKNNHDYTFRFIRSHYIAKKQEEQSDVSFLRMVCSIGVLEGVFYLPNRFRTMTSLYQS